MRSVDRSALRDFAAGVALGIVLFAVVWLLTGCASTPATPDLTTQVRTVTVDRPVIVPCVKPADIPPKPGTAMPEPSAGIKRLAAGASADVRALQAYADELRAALVACTDPHQPAGGKP